MVPKSIWVLPEINSSDEDINTQNLGLLSEARSIGERIGGAVTALLFGEQYRDYSEILGKYGADQSYFFRDPRLKYFSADAYTEAVLARIQEEKPWLFLMGHTTVGKELAPRLAALLNTGIVTNCVRIDLSDPGRPEFYRPVYGDQLYQEVVFETGRTMLVTMNPGVLNKKPVTGAAAAETRIIESKLAPGAIRVRHLEYLPADFQKVDIADAETIVAAGMGAVTDDLLPVVEELATLVQGAIGTTRPVVDGGKIPRERLIGQTGKVVSPDFYLALGISGATHHVGGIQDSGKIIAINRDPQAPIFQSSDMGITADLRDVLPRLVKRIRQAKENGEIL